MYKYQKQRLLIPNELKLNRKLSDLDKETIKVSFKEGKTILSLSEQFKVCKQTIRNAIHGRKKVKQVYKGYNQNGYLTMKRSRERKQLLMKQNLLITNKYL